jgi:hypothetical protein
MTRAKLKLVDETPPERIYGSRQFIAIGRNPALESPARFVPTKKAAGDVVI